MTATPNPVLIFSHPDDSVIKAHILARYAVSQQLAPIVIHPAVMPWLDPDSPVASEVCRSILGMVARHTGGKMWLILRDGEKSDPLPSWTKGGVRHWRSFHSSRATRISSGTWSAWSPSIDAALSIDSLDMLVGG